MIRIPNGLSKSETDLYKYLFTKCDELIREGLTIQEAIQSVVTKFAPFVTDEVTLRLFLQSEITVFSDPRLQLQQKRSGKTDGGMNRKRILLYQQNIGTDIMTICALSHHGAYAQ